MAKLPYVRPVLPVPIRPLPPYPRPPYPVPFPLPVGYNLYPSRDRQESEFMFNGILFDGKSGRPEIDFKFMLG